MRRKALDQAGDSVRAAEEEVAEASRLLEAAEEALEMRNGVDDSRHGDHGAMQRLLGDRDARIAVLQDEVVAWEERAAAQQQDLEKMHAYIKAMHGGCWAAARRRLVGGWAGNREKESVCDNVRDKDEPRPRGVPDKAVATQQHEASDDQQWLGKTPFGTDAAKDLQAAKALHVSICRHIGIMTQALHVCETEGGAVLRRRCEDQQQELVVLRESEATARLALAEAQARLAQNECDLATVNEQRVAAEARAKERHDACEVALLNLRHLEKYIATLHGQKLGGASKHVREGAVVALVSPGPHVVMALFPFEGKHTDTATATDSDSDRHSDTVTH